MGQHRPQLPNMRAPGAAVVAGEAAVLARLEALGAAGVARAKLATPWREESRARRQAGGRRRLMLAKATRPTPDQLRVGPSTRTGPRGAGRAEGGGPGRGEASPTTTMPRRRRPAVAEVATPGGERQLRTTRSPPSGGAEAGARVRRARARVPPAARARRGSCDVCRALVWELCGAGGEELQPWLSERMADEGELFGRRRWPCS
mmetsp:Transcript_22949/g.71162  ORF Transcript_22949/g.71162 Transcript_22949/m.71162 type:complete len:204 (+) Transcript_22949:875-1486(+)